MTGNPSQAAAASATSHCASAAWRRSRASLPGSCLPASLLKKTAICVLDRNGELVWQGKVDSEPGPLIHKFQLWRDQIDLVGLEACPLSEWLHRHLVAAGFKAVCVETRHAQRFLSTRPVKTDKNDARGIAEMMRVGHYRPVHVKSAEAQLIRTKLQARQQIVATLLQIQGSIRGLLRMHGL
jgi:transposase